MKIRKVKAESSGTQILTFTAFALPQTSVSIMSEHQGGLELEKRT